MAVHMLWTLMFLKKCSTEEVNTAWARVHEDSFRDWEWRALTAISYTKFTSVARDYATSVLTIFWVNFDGRCASSSGDFVLLTVDESDFLTSEPFTINRVW